MSKVKTTSAPPQPKRSKTSTATLPYRGRAEIATLTIREVREGHIAAGLEWLVFETFERAAYDPCLLEQDDGPDPNIVDEDSTAWSIWHWNLYAHGVRTYAATLSPLQIQARLKKADRLPSSWQRRSMSAYDYHREYTRYLSEIEGTGVAHVKA